MNYSGALFVTEMVSKKRIRDKHCENELQTIVVVEVLNIANIFAILVP